MPSARIVAALVFALPLVALAARAQGERAAFDGAAFDEAAGTILCDCGCHPQSIRDCACGRAAEMRRDVAAMIGRGMTADEVIADYVARYGEKIRIAPTATGFNLVAWLGPLFGLLAAALAVSLVLRRWTRAAGIPAPAAGPAPLDAAYRERLRRALEELD